MPPLLVVPNHAEDDSTKKNEQGNDDNIQGRINGPFDPFVLACQRPRAPIQHEAGGQNGKVKRWIIVMDVRHARHGDEREVVQEPANHGVDAGVVYVVDLSQAQLLVSTLPAYKVPSNEKAKGRDGSRTSPVDGWVAEEEVFDNVVVPAAHA